MICTLNGGKDPCGPCCPCHLRWEDYYRDIGWHGRRIRKLQRKADTLRTPGSLRALQEAKDALDAAESWWHKRKWTLYSDICDEDMD